MNIKKIKIAIILLIIFILGIILLRYVFYNKYQIPKGAEIETFNEDILVYSEGLSLNNLIKSTNVNILTENMELDTKTTGEKITTFEYKYNGIRKYKYDVTYNVIDTTPPIFINNTVSSKSFYVDEATQEDVEKIINNIAYADNYDINPKINVEGKVNFSEIGTYLLKIIISDSSQNTTSRDLKINIKERPVVTNNNDSNIEKEEDKDKEDDDNTIPFEEQIENYKNENTMVGIDISKWQGEVDFEKIRDSGCEFVIMRIGVMKDKNSELTKDKNFDINYKNAKNAGLKIGIYVYSEANNVNTAISNAEFIIDNLNGDKLDFPVVFDWESWEYFNDMEMNLHMLNEMYDAFDNRLKEAGYDTMLYASEYYLNNVWLDLKDYKIWVAKYSTKFPEIKNKNNNFTIWQNAQTGKIDGIDSNIDMDIYFLDNN